MLCERLRVARRPRLWEESLFLVLAYQLYSLIRNGVPTREAAAFTNAGVVEGFERAVGLGVERSINAAVAGVHWISLAADYWYATMHFVVTLGVLAWLWRSHPLRYRSARSVLMVTNLLALIGFWAFPLAPPRMLPGYVDTVVRDHIWGSWASSGVAAASNQFAAMPSMHVGWSLWCAIVVFSLAQRRWLRVLGAVYPLVTLVVILGTGNHYLLDAVGGIAALAAGFGVQRVMSGRPAFAPPRALPVPVPRTSMSLEEAA